MSSENANNFTVRKTDGSRTYNYKGRYIDSVDYDFTNEVLGDRANYTDSDWEYLTSMNPYLKYRYTPSLWNNLGYAWLGESASENQLYNSYGQNAREQHAKLLAELEKRNYNSPANQKALDAVAGLNSDINGISGTSTAEGLPQDETPPEIPDLASQMEPIAKIGDISMSFIGSIFNMASQIQGLEAVDIDNAQKILSINSGADDYIVKQIAGSLQPVMKKDDSGKDVVDSDGTMDAILQAAGKLDYSNYPRKLRHALQRAQGAYGKDPDTGKYSMAVEDAYWKLMNSYTGNRKGALTNMAGQIWNEDAMDFIHGFAKTINDLQDDLFVSNVETQKEVNKASKSGALAEQMANKNELAYQTELGNLGVPTDKAALEDDQIALSKAQVEQAKRVEETFNDLQKKCEESKSWYGTIGLVLLPMLKSMIMQGLGIHSLSFKNTNSVRNYSGNQINYDK